MMNKVLKLSLLQIKGYSLQERDRSRKDILSTLEEALKSSPDIVLFPECAFPSYSLKDWDEGINEECLSLLEELKRNALEKNCYIVIGLPEMVCDENNKELYNSAYVINPSGEVETIARKQLLWHFDSKWFEAAKRSVAFDTKWGRIGIMICADGRAPEIASSLGLLKCDLVLNCTNWVSSGSDETALSNPQADYLMSVRALEQRFWIAAANKVGMEDDYIVFCGKSMVVDPEGKIISVASSHRAEILECSIPLNEVTGKIDRGTGHEKVPDGEIKSRSLSLNSKKMEKQNYIYAATASLNAGKEFSQAFSELMEKADILGAEVIVASLKVENNLEEIKKALEDTKSFQHVTILNLSTASNDLAMVLYGDEKLIVERSSLVDLGAFKIGITYDKEGLNPYIHRTMMMSGADILIWIQDGSIDAHKKIARARAMENRAFVFSLCRGEGVSSLICGPDGNVISESFEGRNQIIASYLDLILSERKLVVPGTDIKKSAAKYRRI